MYCIGWLSCCTPGKNIPFSSCVLTSWLFTFSLFWLQKIWKKHWSWLPFQASSHLASQSVNLLLNNTQARLTRQEKARKRRRGGRGKKFSTSTTSSNSFLYRNDPSLFSRIRAYIRNHLNRQTDRQTDGQTDRQADRQTDRQTENALGTSGQDSSLNVWVK
jgi:hypothetical protein